jgi:integrase
VVVLALAYGMRRGEVLGLHWSALDWQAATLRVTHGVKRVKDRDASSGRRTRLVISELKTPKSRRTLTLTPELVARFRQHRVRQAEVQMAAGPLWQDHGLIFASEVGTPMDPDNFSHSFARLCEGAGLGHWHPHELRHSGASLMFRAGHAAACGLRGSGTRQHRYHQGRVRYTCWKVTSGRQLSR